jgi:signal transduction histidine kinase
MVPMSSVRLLLVDDSEIARRGIRTVLASRSDLVICGEATDGIEAVEKTKELRPDAVLMDIGMPRMNGIEATRIIRRELPQTKVFIVSQNDPKIAKEQAARVGAWGCIAKEALSSDLIPSIDKTFLGQPSATSISEPARPHPSTAEPFPGNSEMALRMRNFDWSKTAIGRTETWPESLKTAVRICIGSRNPIVLWWGRSALTQFYNDAYISFLGGKKHPAFLGQSARECWSEIWETMAPMLEQVFTTGEATWSEDFLYVLNRNLPREEGYFTFSYSPLWDDAGEIDGIFCACYETTGRVIGDRRLRTLRDLSKTITAAQTAGDACKSAVEVLKGNPAGIPFALVYLLDDAKHARLVAMTGLSSESAAAPDRIDLASLEPEAAWPLKKVFDTGVAETVIDLPKRFGTLPGGPWPESPETALVVPIPCAGQPRPTGFLVAGLSPRRILDADYRSFFDLIAGHISTAVANARTIEQERKRAEALAEIDRAKTTFFSNVSHEFRTPLTLMLGPLQDLLAGNEANLSPEAKEQLELVNRNGARLLRLVNMLLDFSRIEAGRIRAFYQPTDLGAFTADLASSFRSATDRAGLRLAVNCGGLREPVYVDRDMWEKIVLNLLSNAFKFTFEGEIAISVEVVGKQAELHVRDTGVGIPPEALPRVFERFHRIPNTRSRTYEGTGIGLALVQELVKLHGGSIRVESELGKGTTVIVGIPLGQNHLPKDNVCRPPDFSPAALGPSPFVEEALRWLPDLEIASRVSEEPLPLPRPRSEVRQRIVVADDNSDMRLYLTRLLAGHYEVEAFPDGRSALAAIETAPPDLVLTDAMMPMLDGFGLLSALRSDERTCTLPVILLSARAGEESRVEGMQAGADDYLVKPFSARELLARVESHLSLVKVRREAENELRASYGRYRDLAETLETQVRDRTRDLEKRNADILGQTDVLRELSARLLKTQDDERRRLARELHDSAGQLLAGLAVDLNQIVSRTAKQAPEVSAIASEARDYVQQLTQEIRTTSYLLHPPLLDEVGLPQALTLYVDGLMERSSLAIDLAIAEDFDRLPPDTELAVFRMVQECLTNIHRHSGSATASICMWREQGEVRVEIADKGEGIRPDKLDRIRSHGGGVGIAGIRQRVRQLGGRLEIDSDETGTTVTICFPLPETLLGAPAEADAAPREQREERAI